MTPWLVEFYTPNGHQIAEFNSEKAARALFDKAHKKSTGRLRFKDERDFEFSMLLDGVSVILTPPKMVAVMQRLGARQGTPVIPGSSH